MYGYVFIATNAKNGKKFIGSKLAVGFDKKYFGDSPKVIDDIEKYGISSFSSKMLMPYESKEAVEWGLKDFIDKYNALTDPTFYNYVEPKVEDKPKRTRKKKGES